MSGALESIVTAIPGPRSLELAATLSRSEARGVTYLADDYPVFWESGSGALVRDVDGNAYIDCTAAFGVATTGHANPAVVRAIADQAARLPHGMGDVHPTEVKARLLARLAALAPVDDAKSFLCSSGAESIEFALKTARLVTGEPNVLAFAGAYHGLSYGALEVCGIPKFRKPWNDQLRASTTFVRFPDPREPKSAELVLAAVRKALRRDRRIGAVIAEPIQGRAGVIVPPDGFLRGLRDVCSETDTVLVLDEIYTGFGRTGTMFACERDGIRPDVLCVGKALSGGFPISAAIASGEIADAWDPSDGEALHTSTFLGNPMGCAAALANIGEIERLDVPRIAREREPDIAERLHAIERRNPLVRDVRGRGMLWALEVADGATANRCVVGALACGLILLQSGLRGEAITFAPPPVIEDAQFDRAFELFESALRDAVAA
ncbi:MAG: aspartate aminotransferase family protein [Candidatus Eremiobacteraeota bacterium]|nr:aspartate aminotransferase family protein [Candidatus Eremiobacteraeota bacterium]